MKKGKERERARLTFVLLFSLQVYLPFFLWKIESRWKQEREQGQRAGVLNPNKRKGKKVLCLTLLFVPNYPFSNANVCFYSKDEEEKLRGLHRYGGRTQFLLRESWKGALLISSLASAEEFDNFACRNFMCFTRCFASSLFFLPKVFPLLLTNRALQMNVDNDFLPSKARKKNPCASSFKREGPQCRSLLVRGTYQRLFLNDYRGLYQNGAKWKEPSQPGK